MNTEIKVHELKTWPKYFQAIKSGKKTFEVRSNDRDYKVGDILHLKEWNPIGWSSVSPSTLEGRYTGDELKVTVTYVLETLPHEASLFGISSDSVIMSIASQSVATPEAEFKGELEKEKMKFYYASDKSIWEAGANWAYQYLIAAIKKDEPDLVAKDDYEPSKIHPQPSEHVASHTCTEGNSIQQDEIMVLSAIKKGLEVSLTEALDIIGQIPFAVVLPSGIEILASFHNEELAKEWRDRYSATSSVVSIYTIKKNN